MSGAFRSEPTARNTRRNSRRSRLRGSRHWYSNFIGHLEMVRFVSILISMLFLPGAGEPPPVMPQNLEQAYASVLNAMPSEDLLKEANGTFHFAACRSDACLAIDDLVRAVDQLVHRDRPNFQTLLDPRHWDPWADERAAVRILRAHPERNPWRCAALTELARHAAPWDIWPDTEGTWFMERVIEMAVTVRTGKSRCVRQVVAALPRTGSARRLLEEARASCIGDHREGCDLIRLP